MAANMGIVDEDEELMEDEDGFDGARAGVEEEEEEEG